jgi:hypothetical protein
MRAPNFEVNSLFVYAYIESNRLEVTSGLSRLI